MSAATSSGQGADAPCSSDLTNTRLTPVGYSANFGVYLRASQAAGVSSAIRLIETSSNPGIPKRVPPTINSATNYWAARLLLSLINQDVMSGRKSEKDRPGFGAMLKAAHQRKFDILVFWALDRLTREGTRATLNYLQRLESKGVGYVSYQEQWLDSTGPFKDVMVAMFATLAKQERARISERTVARLKVARAQGRILGRPPLPEETVQKVLLLNRDAGIGARKIAKSTGFPLGTVNAILTRSRQEAC